MRKSRFYYLIILFFVNCGILGSQTILDFFVNAPDSSVLQLSKNEREKIVKLSGNNQSATDAKAVIRKHNLFYTFEKVDIKNGYLKLTGAMEGHLEMCFWNLSNGKKLIAIYHEACGPGCYTERLDFYEWSNKKFMPVAICRVLKDFPHKIEQMHAESNFAEELKTDLKETMTFILPRKGKNITVKWGSEEFIQQNRSLMKGNTAVLLWRDGTFVTGGISWLK